jgi:arylsulfatase
MKQIASHFGGTRNGVVISWPGHTTHPEIVRGQFGHVNDMAPTILAAAKIPFPTTVDGVKQIPFEGVSLIPTFTNPTAPSQHREQYFEIFGNRAIYKDGWVAAARRYQPWAIVGGQSRIYDGDFAHDKWELYHVDEDFSEAHDLADKYPDKLKALRAEFDKEARRNDVYPMTPIPFTDVPRMVPAGKTHFVYWGGVDRLNQDMVPTLGGHSHKITAELVVPASGARGVIVAEGGRYGGFSLYVQDGKLIYENNTWDKYHEKIVSPKPLPSGKVEVATLFTVDPLPPAGQDVFSRSQAMGGGPKPGTAQMFVNGQKVGETHFAKFGGFTTSITETFDVGRDTGSTVSASYAEPNAFTGQVEKLTIDLLK